MTFQYNTGNHIHNSDFLRPIFYIIFYVQKLETLAVTFFRLSAYFICRPCVRKECLMTEFRFFRKVLFVVLVLIMNLVGFADISAHPGQEKAKDKPKAQNYKLSQATSEIKVDGEMDEQAWSDAIIIKLPYEWLPGDNIPAPVDTDCLVTFDKDNFYVAFRCYDPDPSKIRAHLMDRDATDILIQDDHVNFMIDTFNDERRGFQFRVNPLGVQADAFLSESEGYEDFSWDAIWNSAGRITDWGYAIEIEIPFNQLRFPRTEEIQTWGFIRWRCF